MKRKAKDAALNIAMKVKIKVIKVSVAKQTCTESLNKNQKNKPEYCDNRSYQLSISSLPCIL